MENQERNLDLPDLIVSTQRATNEQAPMPAGTQRYLGPEDEETPQDGAYFLGILFPGPWLLHTPAPVVSPDSAVIVAPALGVNHEVLSPTELTTLDHVTPGTRTWRSDDGLTGTLSWNLGSWG